MQALASTDTLTDSFDYRVTDGLGGRSIATLAVTIGGTDEPGITLSRVAPLSSDVTLGAGNDRLQLSATGLATVPLSTAHIDGGAGTDTLALIDWNGTYTLPQIAAGIVHVETIELAGGSVQTQLNLTAADLLALAPLDNILRFTGGAEDRIHFDASFIAGADTSIGGIVYHVYTSGTATAYVDVALPVV